MQYQVITSRIGWADSTDGDNAYISADKHLEDKVNGLIADGWQPLGGVSSSVVKNEFVIFSQAMTKE